MTDVLPTAEPHFRMPRILAGIGAFTTATAFCQLGAHLVPGIAVVLVTLMMLGGQVWLAILALRIAEHSAAPERLSSIDHALIRWSGPLALLLLICMPSIAFAFIEQPNGLNRFTSSFGFTLVATLFAAGFVLSLSCVFSRPGTHIAPRLIWKAVCLPLVLIFGAYALLVPVGCTAEMLRAAGN